jgi:AcrR family transcriptional regulator
VASFPWALPLVTVTLGNVSQTDPSSRVTERSRRRKELLDAADAVIRRAGPAASMDAIASEAGISKPILYRHFEDKSGLLGALAQRYVDAVTGELRSAWSVSTDPRVRVQTTIDTYLAFIEKERDIYDFLMHRAVPEDPEAQATIAGFVRQVAQEVSDIMRSDLGAFGLDPALAEPWAYGIVGMVELAGDRWIETGSPTREELVHNLTGLIWAGMVGYASLESERDQ